MKVPLVSRLLDMPPTYALKIMINNSIYQFLLFLIDLM